MAKIPCNICSEKGTVDEGRACPACDGAGEVEAPDGGFQMSEAHKIAMYRMLLDAADKLNDIKEKVDEIKAVVDEL